MRFRVLADAEPSALICILQYLRRSGVAPKSVSATRCTGDYVEVKIEIDDLSDAVFQNLVADVNDMPMVIAAVAFDVDWTHTVSCA